LTGGPFECTPGEEDLEAGSVSLSEPSRRKIVYIVFVWPVFWSCRTAVV